LKAFLKKIKLIIDFGYEVNMDKEEFISSLKNNLAKQHLNIYLDIFDFFIPSKNDLIGYIKGDEFKIRKKKKLFKFDFIIDYAIATGKFSQEKDKIIINTQVNGFHYGMIPFYLIGIFVYSFIMLAVFNTNGLEDKGITQLFLIFIGLLIFGFPYLMMVKSTKRLKKMLEIEFNRLTV
jgi:hypothetical protein